MKNWGLWRLLTIALVLVCGGLALPRLVRMATEILSPASPSATADRLASSDGEVAIRAETTPHLASSGLDLLRAPADLETSPSDRGSPAPLPTSAAQMQSTALGMIDAISPLLSNPTLSKSLNHEQRLNLQELRALMSDVKGQLNSGHSLSDQEFGLKMQRLQGLTLKLMSAAAAPAMKTNPKSTGGK